MRIGEICIRDVVCVDRDTPVQEAARLMRLHHVGNVVIVQSDGDGRTPLGIVTDRDIAVGVVAAGVQPGRVAVGDIMGNQLITIPEDQGIFETVQQIEQHGIRRLPVVDRRGSLVGIITLDDLQEFLAMQLSELSRAIGRERKKEIEARV
jgi:CBS domain-containing protein